MNPFLDEGYPGTHEMVYAPVGRSQSQRSQRSQTGGSRSSGRGEAPSWVSPAMDDTIKPGSRSNSGSNLLASPSKEGGADDQSPGKRKSQRLKPTSFAKAMTKIDRRVKEDESYAGLPICVDHTNENAVIRFLVSDRVYGYPKTNGSFGSNYRAYILNNHPLFSLCCSNTNQSYTLKKRLVVFLCTAAAALTLSYVMWETDFIPLVTTCREGCDKIGMHANHSAIVNSTFAQLSLSLNTRALNTLSLNISSNSTADLVYVCTEGYNAGMSFGKLADAYTRSRNAGPCAFMNHSCCIRIRICIPCVCICVYTYCSKVLSYSRYHVDSYQKQCRYFQDWQMSAIVGVLIVPYGVVLRFVSTCGCLRGRDFFIHNCCGRCIARVLDCCGGGIMLIVAIMNCGLLGWALMASYLAGSKFDVFTTFLLSKCFSFIAWFIYTMPYFTYRYPIDKRHFFKRALYERQNGTASNRSDPSMKAAEARIASMKV